MSIDNITCFIVCFGFCGIMLFLLMVYLYYEILPSFRKTDFEKEMMKSAWTIRMKNEEEDSCSIKRCLFAGKYIEVKNDVTLKELVHVLKHEPEGLQENYEGLKRIIDNHRKEKRAGGLQENYEGFIRLAAKYGYSIDDRKENGE